MHDGMPPSSTLSLSFLCHVRPSSWLPKRACECRVSVKCVCLSAGLSTGSLFQYCVRSRRSPFVTCFSSIGDVLLRSSVMLPQARRAMVRSCCRFGMDLLVSSKIPSARRCPTCHHIRVAVAESQHAATVPCIAVDRIVINSLPFSCLFSSHLSTL